MTLLLQLKQSQKHGGEKFGDAVAEFWEIFREIEHFSLDYRAIRPSAVFGTRKLLYAERASRGYLI